MYEHDSNTILAEPIENWQAATKCNAFLNIHKVLNERGSKPKFYIMDNECFIDLKEALEKYEIESQLAPPHMHRQNASEQAIITYKNHFISVLSETHPDFPIRKLDRILLQCAITLNLL